MHKTAENTFYSLVQQEAMGSIRYYKAIDVKRLVDQIIKELKLNYIDPDLVFCFRSKGSKSRHTVARVHSLEKLWQKALNLKPRYLIEVIDERYNKLCQESKEKVLIHELLHIPKGFAGGFRPHKGYVDQRTINKLHQIFSRRKHTLRPLG